MTSKERDPHPSAAFEAPADERVRELTAVVRRFRSGDYAAANALRGGSSTGMDELLGEIQALGAALGKERTEREGRLNALAVTVLQLASLDFSVKATVSARSDLIDGLASGLNMLREELQSSTVSKAYLDDVFASMSDALLVANRDGTIRGVNHAALDLLGYSEQELVGRSVHTLLREPLSEVELVQARGRELPCATKHGEDVMVSLSASILRGRGSNVDGLVCVLRDVTERKRAEAERLRLEEELRMQAETIRKMSTPLIPINDDVVVMPLVGAVDAERADQVVESLLHGIASRRPHVAIIDITAVAMVNKEVASTIVRAANAARLLGVRVILTGVRPEVAMLLVELAFDLGAVIPCGTLQSGIALSMRRSKRLRRP